MTSRERVHAALLDMADDPDPARAMFARCADFAVALAERACRRYPLDWLWAGGDVHRRLRVDRLHQTVRSAAPAKFVRDGEQISQAACAQIRHAQPVGLRRRADKRRRAGVAARRAVHTAAEGLGEDFSARDVGRKRQTVVRHQRRLTALMLVEPPGPLDAGGGVGACQRRRRRRRGA